MGNHEAGRVMVETALALDEVLGKTGQTPIEILDIACRPYRGCDAEFEEAIFPEHPFGQLPGHVFLDGPYDAQDDPEGDPWWDKVVEKFKKRYELC